MFGQHWQKKVFYLRYKVLLALHGFKVSFFACWVMCTQCHHLKYNINQQINLVNLKDNNIADWLCEIS